MSDPSEPRSWWRRFRFSLRGLMIAIGILGGGMGWIIHRVEVQRATVASIERAGGEVLYDWQWQWKQGRPVRTLMTRWPDWLVERIGVDYLSNVTYVTLRYRGSDELLARIGQLRGLQYLDLAHSPVTDAGMAHLQGLTALQWLSLEDTKIGDAGLVHLKGLAQLQTLLLGLTMVGDAGLPHLKPLTRLKMLSLYLTSVSDDAARDLQRAMPGTRIGAPGWPGRRAGHAIEIYEKAMKAKTDH
ncbi:MAG: hypothetical protein ACLQVF_08870 [Isosphaeraceae bacterium]